MTELPERFTDEIHRAAVRLEARHRHLLLLESQSLCVLERWRAERAYWRHFQPKDI